MNVLRHLWLGALALSLIGCQTRLAGDYDDPPLAKHPTRLHLSSDGTYSFGQVHSAETLPEQGHWWRIQGNVVMLVPTNTARPQWFARVGRNDGIRQLRYSNDVRDVLKPPTK